MRKSWLGGPRRGGWGGLTQPIGNDGSITHPNSKIVIRHLPFGPNFMDAQDYIFTG